LNLVEFSYSFRLSFERDLNPLQQPHKYAGVSKPGSAMSVVLKVTFSYVRFF